MFIMQCIPISWELFSRPALLSDPSGTLSVAKCTSPKIILLAWAYEYKSMKTSASHANPRQHRKALPSSALSGNVSTAITINGPAS